MSVQVYQGSEMESEEKLKQLKDIHARKMYSTPDIDASWDMVAAEYFPRAVTDADDFYIVGTGWYMYYYTKDNNVEISFIMTDGVSDKDVQTQEMIAAFRGLFATYKDHTFSGEFSRSSLKLLEDFVADGIILVEFKEDKELQGEDTFLRFTFKVNKLKITRAGVPDPIEETPHHI